MAIDFPSVVVEIAPAATWQTETPTWVDISSYVRMGDGILYSWGRADETSRAQPGALTFTVNNDGRFTPGSSLSVSAWSAPLRGTGVPVRVRYGSTVLWSGLVRSWGARWRGGRRGVSVVQASDRLALLQRIPFLGMIQGEILSTGDLVAYFPMDEPSSATSFRDIVGGAEATLTQRNGGGTVALGDTAEVTTYSHIPSALFDRAGSNTGWVAQASVAAAGAKTLHALIQPATASGAMTAVHWQGPGGPDFFQASIGVNAAVPFARVVINGVETLLGAASAISTTDGELSHVLLRFQEESSAPGTYYPVLHVNGTIEDSGSAIALPDFQLSDLWIGGGPNAAFGVWDGRIAHVAAGGVADLESSELLTMMTNLGGIPQQWEAESSDERFDRICRGVGLPASWYTSEVGSADMGVQPQSTAVLDALGVVEASERGVVFAAPDGTVTFHSRAHRYAATPIVTLTATDLDPDFEVTSDDAYLVNQVDATIVNGAVSTTYRATNETSVADFGPSPESRTYCLSSATAGEALARATVQKYGAIQPRAGRLTVDLVAKADTVDVDALTAATVGDLIDVTDLPTSTGAPDDEMQFFVEGVSGVITDAQWRLTVNVSPASVEFAWILGDATYSVLGSTTRLAPPDADGGGVG